MDDEDTDVGPPPRPVLVMYADTAEMFADTDEWDDTDREMFAQGTIDTSPQMFEDTGVLVLDQPAQTQPTDRLVVTFRQPSVVTFRETTNPSARPLARPTTADEWPPTPREPAQPAPKRAGIFTIVARPETKY